jgi:hypothetical protein
MPTTSGAFFGPGRMSVFRFFAEVSCIFQIGLYHKRPRGKCERSPACQFSLTTMALVEHFLTFAERGCVKDVGTCIGDMVQHCNPRHYRPASPSRVSTIHPPDCLLYQSPLADEASDSCACLSSPDLRCPQGKSLHELEKYYGDPAICHLGLDARQCELGLDGYH